MFIYKINEFNIVYLKNFYINSYFYFYESNNTLKKNYQNRFYNTCRIQENDKSIFQLIFVSIHKYILQKNYKKKLYKIVTLKSQK
jgi:hypothetical protein